MKKIFMLFAGAMFFAFSAFSQVCTDNNGLNLGTAPAPCSDNPPVSADFFQFEVWRGDQYTWTNLKQGGNYVFDICQGVGGAAWPASFTVVDPQGGIVASGIDAGSTCEISFTAPLTGDYDIFIIESGICPPAILTAAGVDNGIPRLTYEGGATCDPPVTTCEAGTNEGLTSSAVCPDTTTTVSFSGVTIPNSPTQGAFAVEFTPVDTNSTPGVTVAITLAGAPGGVASYTFGNDPEGILAANNLPPFEGEFNVKGLVYSDATLSPFDAANRCDSTDVVVVDFLPVGDPSCEPVVCEAGNIADAAPQAVCPGDDVVLELTGEDFPASSNYALVWIFQDTTVTDSVYFLALSTASPATYNFTGDLNGFLALNGLDTIPPGVYAAFAGVFDFNANNGAGDYCDFTDNAFLLTINAADSPECGGPVPCELPYPQVDPQSLSLVENPNGSLTFSWEPINGQIGCQVQAVVGDIQNPTQVATIIRAGANASSFTANANLLTPFTQYSFRVRCGCQQFPTVIAGPYTPLIDIVTGLAAIEQQHASLNQKIAAAEIASGNHVKVHYASSASVEWPAMVTDAVTPVEGMANIPVKETEVEHRATFNVFPNPTNGSVNFEYNAAAEGILNVRVFDMVGKAVKDFTIATNKGENLMTVDLGSLESGIYMIEVREGNKVSVSRVIIE